MNPHAREIPPRSILLADPSDDGPLVWRSIEEMTTAELFGLRDWAVSIRDNPALPRRLRGLGAGLCHLLVLWTLAQTPSWRRRLDGAIAGLLGRLEEAGLRP